MKLIKKGFFFLSSALVATALVSCGNKDDKKKEETSTSDVTPTSTSTDDFDNAVAIQNFARNIESNNYVVKGNDFEINVASDDAVSFAYSRGKEIRDFVVMSVNDEVFQAFPNGQTLDWLLFVQYGNSVEACAKKGKVLNYMTNIFGDNMFNAFTSLQQEDGLYISHSSMIQDMIQAMGSYPDLVYGSMERTYLKIDNEEATSAHLTTHVYNEVARYDYDIVMDITFGDATVNELAQDWMDNPQYPENPPTWTNNQLGAVDFIFNLWPNETPGNGLPFIQGASYGLYMDMDQVMRGNIIIEDRHMTEQAADNYINVLTSNGFEEAQDEDGDICYRKLLRQESRCYSSVYVDYIDDTFYLFASTYYEYTHYNDLSIINGTITLPRSGSFPELKNDNNIISFDAKDTLMHERESYLYLNEYDLVYEIDINYNDNFDVDAYLDEYFDRLDEAGFIYISSAADPRFSDENGDINFRFNIDYANNTLNLKFKTKKRYSLFEVNAILEDYPDLILGNEIYYYTAHDSISHQYIMKSVVYELNYRLDVYFNSENAANNFIDTYIEALEEQGFTRVQVAGTGRDFEYKNNNGYIFGFDFVVQDDNSVGVLMTFAKEA